MKKRAKVHLLPTDKAENCIVKHSVSGNLYHHDQYFTQEYLKLKDWSSHHLYITTDDEIKEGDWVYALDKVFQITGNTAFGRKIIATTDPKLRSDSLIEDPARPEDNLLIRKGIPKIPQSFFEEYCKVGGIDEVDVEYGLFHDGNFKDDGETHAFKAIRKPRVNSHNEIIIHPVKDSWTKEDLPDLLNRFCKDHSLHRGLQITDGMIREWLEKQ